MKKIIILLIVAAATLTLTALAEDATFETITEALNYTGDRNAVTKLIITGTIAGDDYSDGSEWSEFLWLHKTFPNIEAVEILTDQDIPDVDIDAFNSVDSVYDKVRGLFYCYDAIEKFDIQALWLKNFSAPNVKNIGNHTFQSCENLISVDFPLAEKIGEYAFLFCGKLITINFPVAITIGESAFLGCFELTTLEFPAVTTVDSGAFYCCFKLATINFPAVTTVGSKAFIHCYKLATINFPVVTEIKDMAFYYCGSIKNITLGIGFEEPTTINFAKEVFGYDDEVTPKIDLVLGEYVLPEPDLDTYIWQSNGYNVPAAYKPYKWKSITKHNSISEIINTKSVKVVPNPATESTTLSLELETAANLRIILCDALGQEIITIYNGYTDVGAFSYPINIKNLAKGVYFVKLIIDNESIVEKIIVT